MSEPHAKLASKLGTILTERGWSVTTAESCTGGGLSCAITAVSGASHWFHAGFVCYSNNMKSQILGVREATLKDQGAVSKAVVEEMLLGAMSKSAANCAIAVSGIAGPKGGTPDKPVGTVVVGVAVGEHTDVHACYFKGDRAAIRSQAIEMGLGALIDLISEKSYN